MVGRAIAGLFALVLAAALPATAHAQKYPEAEGQALDLLKHGIGFRTVSGPGNQTFEYATYLKGHLVAGGFADADVTVTQLGDTEQAVEESEPGLANGVDVAARLADAHGDDAGGLATLERALAKHSDAPAIERARALAYRADLAIRLDRPEHARASLDEIGALDLDDDEHAGLAAEFDHVEALLR